jgi:hypothetical protein
MSKATLRDPHNKLLIGTLDGLDAFGWPELDEGIRHYVCVLRSQGIETCQSCEGGHGHSYPEPTIEFHGGPAEGPRAVAVALCYGLPIAELRRVWSITDGEMTGPLWAMTFYRKSGTHQKMVAEREAEALEAMGKSPRTGAASREREVANV